MQTMMDNNHDWPILIKSGYPLRVNPQ